MSGEPSSRRATLCRIGRTEAGRPVYASAFTGSAKDRIHCAERTAIGMASLSPEISLVVPVYNEADNLPVLAREITAVMAASGRPWELILVDDGSSDASLSVMRELAAGQPEVRYVAFAANYGQSAAFAAGFAEARGEVIVTLDADLQNDPADIPAMLALYGKDGVSMVAGWRARRRDGAAKRWASKLGNWARNALSDETIRDTGCSLKALHAGMAKRLPMFSGMHRFLPTLMKMQGAKVVEMQVNHRPRLHGVSKYGIWDRARKTFFDLLAVRWMQRRHVQYVIKERKD